MSRARLSLRMRTVLVAQTTSCLLLPLLTIQDVTENVVRARACISGCFEPLDSVGEPSVSFDLRPDMMVREKKRARVYSFFNYFHQIHPHLAILVLQRRYPYYGIFVWLATVNNRI
ncbi:hypothetical protein ARMSODRAFT_133474 [Armillaria solidipes]|uniref:Secreted protein n=1 Tax=Armillaria solidipes TaxID=1076256 RepID=A0A2H3ANR0_9AGAR|nr:hypothetical protein ARMSODRAFT_133474 [Armillaria solidipes]